MKNRNKLLLSLALALPVLSSCGGSNGKESLSVAIDSSNPMSAFALSKIKEAAEGKGLELKDSEGKYTVKMNSIDETLGEEAYRISVQDKAIEVVGGDKNGLMYGGLDLAEQIELYGIDKVSAKNVSRSLKARGLKFNIPLDMRTPSYTDGGDSGQSNIPVMWDLDFWKQELDMMALNRMNHLTLWNLNPFPSMVKVPGYEDCALDDVWRTTEYFDDSFKGTGNDLVRESMYEEGHYEIVKKMTIDEKIAHWKAVMDYAHDRGVRVIWYTWNVYAFGEHGKYGITPEQDNPKTKAYFRAAVEAFLDTYPQIDGLGVAAGENMNAPKTGSDGTGMGSVGYGDTENEQWLHDTYGEGIKASLAKTPDRKFEFIHRMHYSDADSLRTIWSDLPCPLSLSDKYSTAHMYAVEEPHLIDPTLEQLQEGQDLYLEMRNDDHFFLRYGGFDFLRAYITKIPKRVSGYFMGADGYVQGKEFTSKVEELKGLHFMRKHWINYMLLGRIGYQNDISDDLLKDKILHHFKHVGLEASQMGDLHALLNSAGKILPASNILYYVGGDSWYPAASWTNENTFGYIGVKRLIKAENPHPFGNTLTIPAYATAVENNETITQKTPLDVMKTMRDNADIVMAKKDVFSSLMGKDAEFDALIKDQICWANLGYYLANKYDGILDLRFYNDLKEDAKKTSAVEKLTAAVPYWEAYANDIIARYTDDVRLSRAGIFSFSKVTGFVKEDVETAQKWSPRTL